MSLLIAFSGQGFQNEHMFSSLCQDSFGKTWLKEASQIMKLDLFDEHAVRKACDDVIQVQCLIAILSVGAFYAFQQDINFNATLLCGYSLGEVSAFCVSTNLSVENVCNLVKMRAQLMREAAVDYTHNQPSGLMVLKGRITANQAKQLAQNHACYIAIINADDHYIVGGLTKNLDALIAEAKAAGVMKAEKLAVNLPSHTPMLTQATQAFADYLKPFQRGVMQYPILNALTQEIITDAQAMVDILAKELSQPLHWDRLMHIAREYGINTVLELGPGSALKNMFAALPASIKAYSLADFASVKGMAKHL